MKTLAITVAMLVSTGVYATEDYNLFHDINEVTKNSSVSEVSYAGEASDFFNDVDEIIKLSSVSESSAEQPGMGDLYGDSSILANLP